jgi:hypothetical protein
MGVSTGATSSMVNLFFKGVVETKVESKKRPHATTLTLNVALDYNNNVKKPDTYI